MMTCFDCSYHGWFGTVVMAFITSTKLAMLSPVSGFGGNISWVYHLSIFRAHSAWPSLRG